MKELRAEMTKRQAENGTPYFLSAAVPASTWGTASDRFDFKTLNNYVDYINLMSYDLNNGQKQVIYLHYILHQMMVVTDLDVHGALKD